MKSSRQHGFTVIEIVLVLAIVGAIGAAVYFALNRTGDHATETKSPTGASPTATASSTATPAPASTIKIKELGVQLPASAAIADLTYARDPRDIYGLSSTKLTTYDSACTSDNLALGYLSLEATAEVGAGLTKSKALSNGKTLVYYPPQGSCATSAAKAPGANEIMATQRAALETAVASATLLP